MDTETLDKLYLEWSQFTKAKTAKELMLEKELLNLQKVSFPLAMMCLQSERYPTDADFRQYVDDVLHMTQKQVMG